MTQDRQQRDWDDLAEQDPLWAILSVDEKESGGWDSQEFFDTGSREIHQVMGRARQLGYPAAHDHALDFGCGVGRVTRAMASHFGTVVGLDISPAMLALARRLNDQYPACRFEVSDHPDLRQYADRQFDFVYSNIVLQHVADGATIERYVREFVRVLNREGLLVFQLPTGIPLRYRLQPRRRAYSLLRALGLPPQVLHDRLRLHPIRMTGITEANVLRTLDDAGALVLDVQRSVIAGFGIPSNTYWVTRT